EARATTVIFRAPKFRHKIEIQDFYSRNLEAIHDVTIDFVRLINALPADYVRCFSKIRILRESFEVAGVQRREGTIFAKNNVIDLYLSDRIVEQGGDPILGAIETFYHEFGHALARYLFGNVHPGPKWLEAMRYDGNEISRYSAKKRYENHAPKDN